MAYSGYTDEKLFDEMAEGNQIAFSVLYERFFGVLYAYAYKLTKDPNYAEDIIQEIFISLWDNRLKIDISISVSNYLYGAVRYQFYKLMARNKIRQDLSDQMLMLLNEQTPDTDAEYLYMELESVIISIAEKMPSNMGEIFIKSRILQLSNQEIADDLQLSEKTIRNQLSLARQHIKYKLLRMKYFHLIIHLPVHVYLLERLFGN